MDDSRRLTEVKVGLFVLVALLVLIAGSLWIVGSGYFAGERVSYRVLLKDSKGVKAGDRVRLAGVSIGRIQSVDLRPEDSWPVMLQIAVKEEVPVREDGGATIASSGLMGTSFLQILPGSPDAPLLPPGGTIRGESAFGIEGTLAQVEQISVRVTGILDQTSGLVEEVSGELGPILIQLRKLLSDDNVEEVGAILGGLRGTLDQASPRLVSLLARMERLTGNVEGATEDVPELIESLTTVMGDVHTALGPDGSRLTALLESAQSSLGSADEALTVIGENRGELEMTLRDLRETMANLKDFSRQIKQRPSSLIRNQPAPDRRPGQDVKESPR